jgi:hypothetical protein
MWKEVFSDKKEIPFFLEVDDCTEEVPVVIEKIKQPLTRKEAEEKANQ